MYIIKNKEQFDLDFELAHLLFWTAQTS
jgi:hypothetical protein